MELIGATVLLLPALLSLGLAALMAWAGLRAARELGLGFRSQPPGVAGAALAIAGVALPVLLIVVFVALLAVVLLQKMLNVEF